MTQTVISMSSQYYSNKFHIKNNFKCITKMKNKIFKFKDENNLLNQLRMTIINDVTSCTDCCSSYNYKLT